jgi:serine/threonine protein phosphatase PrpC
MQCQICDAVLPDDDLFCEACGAPVKPAAEPVAGVCPCGAPASEIDEDGFCERCGRRARRPDTDHIEVVLSAACAGVSDRGLRHDRNEDRFAIHQGGAGCALVVCDGVSASRQSEIASGAVSEGVAASLAASLARGPIVDGEAAVRQAIVDGEANLAAQPGAAAESDSPSTTVVAAIVADGHVTLGWVGDSRAYWIDGRGARQLTCDHSWMNDVVSAGEMSPEDAERDPRAHAITHWLGADAGDDAAASTAHFDPDGPGTLLLCTDGLWNYAPSPEQMARLVQEVEAAGGDALAVA